MNPEDKYYQLAKTYAQKQGFPMVRYIGTEDNLHIFNMTNPKLWEHKIGMPRFISINENMEIKEVTQRSSIMKYLTTITSNQQSL